MVKQKEGLKYFVRRELGPDFTLDEAAALIEHTEPGMRKMYNRDRRKLKALFLGYMALSKQESEQAAA